MTQTSISADVLEAEIALEPGNPQSPTRPEARRRRRRRINGQLVAALAIIAILVLVSLLAPLLAPDDPNLQDFANRYLEPGQGGHLLGTDKEGRDVFSRLLYGGRSTLLFAIIAETIAVLIGTVLGLLAAFGRGWVSAIVMRFVDLMLAFPVIMVALALAEAIGTGGTVVIIAIVVAAVPYVSRIVFGAAKRERGSEYVDSARALGAGGTSVLFREVLPNLLPLVIVYWSSLIGIGVVFAASLSAIGIGVQDPTSDWGRMMADGAQVLLTGSPWQAIVPGLLILLVGLAFNWLGDGLRDALDPHSDGHRGRS